MAVELKFCKEGSIPWGFRLTGGSDYEAPLTVVKVSKGSIAEQSGMQEGDLVTHINNIRTEGLTHIEAHDVILQAGTNFIVAVNRGELPVIYEESLSNVQNDEFETQLCVQSMETDVIQSEKSEMHAEVMNIEENMQMSETRTTEAISGEVSGDALPEQELMGVDFQKLIPNVESLKESEVLKALNEETTETKQLKNIQEQKWTTFLQKPKRPKPKIEKDEEALKEPPYRVVIIKGKKREPNDSPQTSQGSMPALEESITTPDLRAEHEEPVQEQEPDEQQENEEENIEKELLEAEDEPTEPVCSEVEMSLEEQLAAVQRQLLALSQLPAAIQQTLNVVTSQLAKIVGPINDPNTEEENEVQDEVDENSEDREDDYDGELEILDEIPEEGESEHEQYQDEKYKGQPENDVETIEENGMEQDPEPEPEPELTEEEREYRRIEQEKENKKLKEIELLEEQHQRRIKQRPSFPLTPLQRPILLPGGRRWKMPGDAVPVISHHQMSDDVIAETISSQTEIITGTTLGINFLKYQPIPKTLDHLKNSEVYKLVHDLEPAPVGIQSRQGKAMAEEDYYTQIRKEAPQEHNDALNK